MHDDLTDVPGLLAGHYTNEAAATGCTVVLCAAGAVAGVEVRGSSPGTRETDLLRPGAQVEQVHAVLLSGGSAFGLDAAGGVMRYLEERGAGFQTRAARVPIVPAAILYDLGIGDAKVRPGPDDAYHACESAASGPIAQGSVGAGTGATVAKALGPTHALKGGIGSASAALPDGTILSALIAVNSVGDIVDPATGLLIAGPRDVEHGGFLSALDLYLEGKAGEETPRANTTIGVVATNATLSKEQVNKLAQMANSGVAQTIRPAHTMSDGDVLFSLATGAHLSRFTLSALGAVAAHVVSRAILNAVLKAKGLAGVPSVTEWTLG